MTSTQSPVPCPRCGAPVAGEFKFCPTCAYRLRAAPEWEAEPPRRRTWSHAVLVLFLGGLFAAILVIGYRLFVEPAVPPSTNGDTQPELRGPLTIGHLRDRMTHLYGGTATYAASPDDEADWPVQVGDCLFGELEVSRGEWREFMDACEADPDLVATWLRDLWRPTVGSDPLLRSEDEKNALAFANRFLDAWWERVQEHHAEVYKRDVERPGDFVAPLPLAYGNLLLAPPSWVRIGTFEDFSVALPEGTERLPVTDVSWFDALAFAAWARGVTGLDLRLPTAMEWIRAGNSGESERLYPWDDPRRETTYPPRYACNSLLFWGLTDTPELLRVDYRFADGGRTAEGIEQMSGNAREWLHNHELVASDGYYAALPKETILVEVPRQDDPDETELVPKVIDRAPTIGGSFRDAIEDCRVDMSSVRFKSKFGRWDDVGFRLWAPSNFMGGG